MYVCAVIARVEPGSRAALAGIASGETDGMQAFMGGKLRAEGDMMLAMKLSDKLCSPIKHFLKIKMNPELQVCALQEEWPCWGTER